MGQLRRFLALALLAALPAFLAGCEKQVEEIRIHLFPEEQGKPGKAVVPPPARGRPCRGAACPRNDPPAPPPDAAAALRAPMQAPPKPGGRPPDGKSAGQRPKKPGPAVLKPAPVRLASAGGGGGRPRRPSKPEERPGGAGEPDRTPAPRPDRYSVEKDGGSRYLSPAQARGPKVVEAVVRVDAAAPAAKGAAPAPTTVSVEDVPVVSPVADSKEDILGLVAEDAGDIGGRRVQISRDKEFKAVLFDKTYSFIEDADLYEEFRKARLRDGVYWMRSAMIDLLDFQHPFSEPKKFRLRGSAAATKAYPPVGP